MAFLSFAFVACLPCRHVDEVFRKILLPVLILLCGVPSLSAQVTPYEYKGLWYVSIQGGASYFNGDDAHIYRLQGQWWTPVGASGALSGGYNIANGHELRLSAAFGKKNASRVTYKEELHPYSFQSVSIFADYALAFLSLAENFNPFNPKLYLGAGCAYSFNFDNPWSPELPVHDSNWVPAFHFGTILEYDFPSGLGLFADIGLCFYDDPYDGQGRHSFVLDMDVGLNFGVIYHIKQ